MPGPSLKHPSLSGEVFTLLPGLLLALLLSLVAIWLADQAWMARIGLSALPLAILSGMLLGNTAYRRLQNSCGAGVGFAKQKILRAGIILFGMRITFQDVATVGWGGIAIDTLMVGTTFLLAMLAGRHWLRLDREDAILIGAGSSICGAAAVLAAEPVVKADSSKVAVAVATVVVFGTLSMFLYPVLHSLLPAGTLSSEAYGIYVGSTVHEVAQVVVAGDAISKISADLAVITKMIRVMMLAPFLLSLSAWLARDGDDRQATSASAVVIPWFALWFIAVAGFNSLHLLPEPAVNALVSFDTVLLAMAMAALGLTTHFSAIRAAGTRPLLLAALLWAWLIVGGIVINEIFNK